MSFYVRTASVNEPFTFDTIGNNREQERVIRPKGYPVYHYIQTEKGRGRIEIQGKSYILNEKEGVLLAPFVSHSYSAETESWTTLFATITGNIESSIPQILGNRKIIFTDKEQGTKIESIISSAIKKYETPPPDARALSIDCYCFLMSFVDGIYQDELKNNLLYQKYVAPIVKEIETNYHEKLTADDLSKKVYVTPQYLSRLFRRFLGSSVYEYLTLYRITKAKEFLLSKPNLEIQNISHLVGFDNASHFIAIFKKTTGITPLEFRQLNRFNFF